MAGEEDWRFTARYSFRRCKLSVDNRKAMQRLGLWCGAFLLSPVSVLVPCLYRVFEGGRRSVGLYEPQFFVERPIRDST